MQIITDNKPRLAVCWHQLPKEAQEDFDYLRPEQAYDARYVRYKGVWYDIEDTQRITTTQQFPMGWAMLVQYDSPLAKWDAIISETYFSGVLFRFIRGEGHVVVGRYFS